MKISDLFARGGRRIFSFEFFPPKTEAGQQSLERTIRDLYGLQPLVPADTRRWLDHGRWGMREPLGKQESGAARADAYAFRLAEGPPMHQIPVGPVHAGIIEPGHFRFTANGETVVRLEQRLGYVHKGIDSLMVGATLDKRDPKRLTAEVPPGFQRIAANRSWVLYERCGRTVHPPSRSASEG